MLSLDSSMRVSTIITDDLVALGLAYLEIFNQWLPLPDEVKVSLLAKSGQEKIDALRCEAYGWSQTVVAF
jgi:hypothetical protein